MSLETIWDYVPSTEQQKWPWEWQNKVNEQDVARVRESQQKAKQIWWQISQSKKNNNAIALFLAFLMQNINDDIIFFIYKIFFTKSNVSTWSKELKNNIYWVFLVAMFVPFYIEKSKEFEIYDAFVRFELKQFSDYVSYIDYISRLSAYYNIVFDQIDDFYQLLYKIIIFYGIYDEKKENSQIYFLEYIKKSIVLNTEKSHTHSHTHHRKIQ